MNKFATLAPILEKIFLAGLLVGVILTVLTIQPLGTSVIVVSLYGWAIACYLSAFQRFDMPTDESRPNDIKALLANVIMPKLLWISCAVSLVAAAFFAMNAQMQGIKQMAMIGGLTITAAVVMVAFISLGEMKIPKPIAPALMRALPLLLIDIFLWIRNS